MGNMFLTIFFLGIVAGGAFYYGYVKGNANAEIAIQKFINQHKTQEVQIQKAQTQIQTKVVTKYITRTVTLEKDAQQNDKIITQYVPDVNYQLSNGWVNSYNYSISGKEIPTSIASDSSLSNINPTDALKTINENNKACLVDIEQIKGLQDYINKTNESIRKVNAGN